MPENIIFSWEQPSLRTAGCELLLDGSEVAAIMRWEEIGVTVATIYNRWLFRQTGLIRTTILVKNGNTEQVEAVYKVGWRSGGKVQLNQDLKQFDWRSSGSKINEWLDNRGERLARFNLEVNPKGKRGSLETDQEQIDQPEFEILMALGWFLCVNQLGFGGFYDRLPDGTPGNGGPLSV